MLTIAKRWTHMGAILPRGGPAVGGVVGDPCVVWDDDINGWRMFLFVEKPGVGEAICLSDNVGPGSWQYLGPLRFTNPQDILGGYTHKPYVIQDAFHPNRAACIDGKHYLVSVSYVLENGVPHKVVQQAYAISLAGPWTVEKTPLINIGEQSQFDGKHIDAVSGFYFEDRHEILYFYMGYPAVAQNYALSPFGSAQAVAVQQLRDKHATKLAVVLPPSDVAGHWASGYIGGLQIFPGKEHKWIALANASPTPPKPELPDRWREEPPPSLGGFAYCDEEWPIKNWHWYPDPIEWIEDIPPEALRNGEGVNLWRHHLLCLPDGKMAIFYNSGSYGEEQLYMKLAERE